MARAYDGQGEPLSSRVRFRWKIVEGEGRLRAIDGDRCTLTAREPNRVVVEVQADKGVRRTTDQVAVKFVENNDGYGSARGLPSYRLQAEPSQKWRSRYDVKRNEIIINSAHRDFLASRSKMAICRKHWHRWTN